jgi:hypothetical protein
MIAHVDGEVVQADPRAEQRLPSAPIAAPVTKRRHRVSRHDRIAKGEPGNR